MRGILVLFLGAALGSCGGNPGIDAPTENLRSTKPAAAVASCLLSVAESKFGMDQVRYQEISARNSIRLSQVIPLNSLGMGTIGSFRPWVATVKTVGDGSVVEVSANQPFRSRVVEWARPCL